MKVLGLNASARKEGNTSSLLAYALKIIEKEKFDAELLHLSDFEIRSCSGCKYECLYEKPCPLEDECIKVIERISRANRTIVGSPVYAGNMSAILKAFFERANSLSLEQISKLWRNKPIAIFVVGSLGNTHTLQGIFTGVSSGYGGIEPLIVGTAIISTRSCKYPEAWREGGLIDDPVNQQLIKKLVERLLSAVH